MIKKWYAIDCETTGLYPYKGDELFSVAVWGEDGGQYYDAEECGEETFDYFLEKLALLALDPGVGFFFHNAKFDMAFLDKRGVCFESRLHDTMVVARLLDNTHFSYSLDACAQRTLGLKKSTEVEEYIAEHRLWSWEDEHKKRKIPNFRAVPVEVMKRYALKDVELTFALGMRQLNELEQLSKLDLGLGYGAKLLDVYLNECELTKTCFQMEQVGILIDREYCKEAIRYEDHRIALARERYKELTQREFKDSRKELTQALGSLGTEWKKTAKGNITFSEDVLEKLGTPIAQAVLEHRDALKSKTTYFENFLRFADSSGVLHANIRQAGTATGRFSMSDPNLQNITKEDEDNEKEDEEKSKENEVRRAFVARPDFCLVEIDYKAMEFRMLVNYANHSSLAKSIIDGLDPHQATADLIGITRKQAKTLNFGLLYGMGAAKLGNALKISELEAANLRKRYFMAIPQINRVIKGVTEKAKVTKKITNWFGRTYYFPDPNFAYKATNYLIQGGCAEVVKIAMNRCSALLKDKKTKMLLQVHDALLFEVHKSELNLISEIKNIMENSFTKGILPLQVDIKHSWHAWSDLVAGEPNVSEARNHIQKKGA